MNGCVSRSSYVAILKISFVGVRIAKLKKSFWKYLLVCAVTYMSVDGVEKGQ